MNIILLETKLNLRWTSMQEILPQLESLWSKASKDMGHGFQVINVDDSTPKQWAKCLLKADLIVVSAFNVKIAGFLKVTRELFGVKTPWAFYLHNQATIGLWPLYEFGVGELLHSGDTFIGTCEGDRVLIEKLFKGAQFCLIPFFGESKIKEEITLEENIKKVIFVGRISEQKNLHLLLVAVKLLNDNGHEFELTLYGKEDNLGSPNMAQQSSEYLALLKALSVKLGIVEKVTFAGFVSRDELQKVFETEQLILCSPSLHSDENFGMALLMGLMYGQRIVASDWGGHANYISKVPELSIGCSVFENDDGPFINVRELSNSLLKVSRLTGGVCPDLSFFTEKNSLKGVELILEHLRKGQENEIPLIKTKLLKSLLEGRNQLKEEFTQKVFEGYSDPLALEFFKAYGAIDYKFEDDQKSFNLLPWVHQEEIAKESYTVSDPHKGERTLNLEELKKYGYAY